MGSKYDPKGDIRHTENKRANQHQGQSQLLPVDHFPSAAEQARMLATCKMLQCFLHRDDGYLKVRREADSIDIHLTWTWTLGKYSRSYVYVRIEEYNVGYGLELLEAKLNNVLEGRTHPTPDRYYK